MTKTSSSCLSSRIVLCICLWSRVQLPAESDLKQIVEHIHYQNPYISRSDTPIDFWRQRKHYTANQLRTFVQDLLSVRRLRRRGKLRIFSVCGLLTSGHRNRVNKILEMRMCNKLNSKMLRDSGFVFYTDCIVL